MNIYKTIIAYSVTMGCNIMVLVIIVSLLFVDVVHIREPNIFILALEIFVVGLGLYLNFRIYLDEVRIGG